MGEVAPAPLRTALHRRYTIRHELGRGGAAFVYLAHDLKHDRSVAIKVLRAEIAVLLGAERFLREIRFAAQLQHPNILSLFDSGEAGGWLYYVMPYVEGHSLRQRLTREGPLPLDDALRITRDVCGALGCAHGQGVVHRDIKPENILLSGEHAVVADFGLALAITSAGGEKLSESGMSVGTPAYMSPEQAGTTYQIDGRSDLYSLGCVLYEMLAGTPPFTGPSTQALLARHALDAVPPLKTVRKSLPEHVEQVVMRALEKVPADRFASAAALATALEAPASIPRRSLRSRRVAALVAGIGLLLGGGWLATRARSADAPVRRRLAVLPLENLTGDSTQNSFVDVMHQGMIDELAKVEAVSVISRASVLRYRDSPRPPLPEIARQLGVDAIVQASVSRSGDSMRLAVQLVDARTDRRLWTQTYVRARRDVLRLSGELASDVVGQIRGAITRAERSRLAGERQVDPDVYTLTLKGGYECLLWTEGGIRRGIQLLREAVDRDPSNALAYAKLAGCYSDVSFFGYMPDSEATPLVQAANARALELDSTVGEAYVTRGWFRFVTDHDTDGADRDFRRALELAPGDLRTRQWHADYLTLTGRFDEAVSEKRQAIALDPLSAQSSIGLVWTYFYARRYDEAIAQVRRTLNLAPGSYSAHMLLGWNYSLKEVHDVAVAHCDSAFALKHQPDNNWPGDCGWVYARAGHREQVLEMLRHIPQPCAAGAGVYVALGDPDHALECLRKEARENPQGLAFENFYPALDPLRSDPRSHAVLRELGIKP